MSSESIKGKLIVVTAPSGAGKTTLVKHLLEHYPQLAFSVSATTRKPRPHEIHGREYYFIALPNFRELIQRAAFVEWEEVYTNQFYGTLKSELKRIWAMGKHIMFDIDVKGALNIKKHYPENTLTIFVKPPSKEVLFERLIARNTENEESLQRRMQRAEEELSFESRFDKVVINDDLESAKKDIRSLVETYLESKLHV